MKNSIQPSGTTSMIGIILLITLVVVSAGWVAQYLQPKGRISCASFGSYGDIPTNWKSTTPWLDRNHNGIPCDTLHKIDFKTS